MRYLQITIPIADMPVLNRTAHIVPISPLTPVQRLMQNHKQATMHMNTMVIAQTIPLIRHAHHVPNARPGLIPPDVPDLNENYPNLRQSGTLPTKKIDEGGVAPHKHASGPEIIWHG